MLTNKRSVWIVGAAATLITALVTGAALAVLGEKVVPAGADGLASARFTQFTLGYKTNESLSLTAGLRYSDLEAGSSTGFVPSIGSNYFQSDEKKTGLGIAANAGFVFRDDTITDKITWTGPVARGNSFYRNDDMSSFDGYFYFEWTLADVIATGIRSPLYKDIFGIGNGSWKNVDYIPRAQVGDFTIPTLQQTEGWFTTFRNRQDDLRLTNGLVVTADLGRDYIPVTVDTSKFQVRAQYQDILDDEVSLGDAFYGTHRTDEGTSIKITRRPFSPQDSVVQLNHSFAYSPNGRPEFNTQQVEALRGPSFSDDLIPEDVLMPRYQAVATNGVRLVVMDGYSDRQYYYGNLLEAFGFTDDEIDAILDEIGRWEEGLPNVFDGYEQGYWGIGASQAGPKTTARKDPQPVLKQLPNDGYFHGKGSWGQDYDDQWGLKQIGITATGRDGKGSIWPRKAAITKVAVVDTGIDFGHPELDGVLAANFGETPNNGKDDDGNGYVDDFLGWNFVDSDNNTRDMNGHGTFVAGIIAANTDNGRGIAGVNPWARIIPVRVTDFDNVGSSAHIALGIIYAAKLGARVINVSIAGPMNKAEQAAVKEAVKHGALVVVAAGNDGKDVKDVAPAGLEGVITVAATNPKGQREKYSNWGPNVDVAAPGTDILSLRAIQTDLMRMADKDYKPGENVVGSGRRYYRLTGTSFSAPYVTGVASLLFSLNPKLTADQVKRMILQSATDIENPGVDQFTGYGLLNAAAAVKADPAFYVEARIDGVKVVKKNGQNFVQIQGTVDADHFAGASVEIGAGREPNDWKKVSDVTARVKQGAVTDIAAQNFAGEQTWTLRLVAKHENGRTREHRFILNTN